MSASLPCPSPKTHRPLWRVRVRKANYSKFNGRRRTPSDYSELTCTAPGCVSRWRTKAAYVDTIPDLDRNCRCLPVQ